MATWLEGGYYVLSYCETVSKVILTFRLDGYKIYSSEHSISDQKQVQSHYGI